MTLIDFKTSGEANEGSKARTNWGVRGHAAPEIFEFQMSGTAISAI